MINVISQQELEKYLWGAATLLRGVIDSGDYKSIIFPIMFFKRISDVYDEEYQNALKESEGDEDYASNKEFHRFQIPNGSHWKDIRKITKNVGREIQNALISIEKANPDKLNGIFGDSNLTNKDRLSDQILLDLIEHFSTLDLSVRNIPDDQFGNAYEYLIKKFADDSGHTAAEFYTNRTVVRLMTLIVDPKSNESIYDPTCGSGGMLLNAYLLAKEQGKEYRNIKLYGQEINLITSAISRMNMFIHGIEEFHIVRGDTLSNPLFIEGDKVKQFDIVLANPPYSIKKWNQESWKHDSLGRNIWGVPPQGCADYAFFQHIICSLKEKTGRCAILWPHGVLFRDSEQSMRKEMIESDVIECIIGLGPNLFYNSPMDSCIVICNKNKPKEKRGKVIFIRAYDQYYKEKTQSFLSEDHIQNVFNWYKDFKDVEGRVKISSIEDIRKNKFVINVALYVRPELSKENIKSKENIGDIISSWKEESKKLEESFSKLQNVLKEIIK